MNIKATLRYHAADIRSSLAWYYGILLLIATVLYGSTLYLTNRFGIGSVSVEVGGFTGVTVVYLFIAGLVSYKADFFYFLQNGISRKTHFVSLLMVGAALALITGVMDLAIDGVAEAVVSRFGLGINQLNDVLMPASSFPLLSKFLTVVFGNGTAFFTGILISSLFYRLNTLGKILVPVSVVLLGPALVIFNVNTQWLSRLAREIETFARSGIPAFLLIRSVYVALIIGGTWLLQRRAQVKTNVS